MKLVKFYTDVGAYMIFTCPRLLCYYSCGNNRYRFYKRNFNKKKSLVY